LCAIPGKPVANVEDPARMAAHKFFPGRAVALEALLDQLGILFQPSSASNRGMSWPAHDGTKIATEKFPAPSQEWDDCAHLTHPKGETQADTSRGRSLFTLSGGSSSRAGGQAFTPWDDEYGGFTGVPRAFAFAPAFHNGLLTGSHLLSQFQHLGDAVPVAAGARHVKHLSDLGPTEFRAPHPIGEINEAFTPLAPQFLGLDL